MIYDARLSHEGAAELVAIVQDALITRELLLHRGYGKRGDTLWNMIGPNLPHRLVPESEAFKAAVAKRTAQLAALKPWSSMTVREADAYVTGVVNGAMSAKIHSDAGLPVESLEHA